jgi:hypothetical protein
MSIIHGLALESMVFVKGLDPVADFFDATVLGTYPVVNFRSLDKVLFIIYKGVGTTGTATITVNACDNTTPSNTTAIPFFYRRCDNTSDTQGTITRATASGFATTAGSSEVYVIEVNKEDLASTGYGYVQLGVAEVVDSPVIGSMLTVGVSVRHAGATASTILS